MTNTVHETKPTGSQLQTAKSNRIRFRKDTEILIDGVSHVAMSSNQKAILLRQVENPEVTQKFTYEELHALKAERRLIENRGAYSAKESRLEGYSELRLTDLDEKTARMAMFRWFFCDRFLAAEAEGKTCRSDAAMRDFIDCEYLEYLKQEKAKQSADGRLTEKDFKALSDPSPSSLRRWLRKYEKSGFNPISFVSRYHKSGNKTDRFPKELRQILRTRASQYASLLQPTYESLHQGLRDDVEAINNERAAKGLAALDVPSMAALRREVYKISPFHLEAGRKGDDAARKKFAFVQGTHSIQWPLQRVEIDECLLPIQTLIEDLGAWNSLDKTTQKLLKKKVGRVWLSVAIDVRTKCVLAMQLAPTPTANLAISTLQMAMSDKTPFKNQAGCKSEWDMYGQIQQVCTDNGSSYISREFRSAAVDSGCEIFHPPAKRPFLRGSVERFFDTLENGALSGFEGRTFSNVVVRGDYPAEERAALTVRALGEVLVRWVVDIYHNTQHGGLGTQTPRECWLELSEKCGIESAPSSDEMRAHFGPMVQKKFLREGIKLFGNNYNSPELHQIKMHQRVDFLDVRYDPYDLGEISVRTRDGWLSVGCKNSDMQGVSLSAHIENQQKLRARYGEQAKLTKEIRERARRDLLLLSEQSRNARNISSPVLHADVSERLEAECTSSWLQQTDPDQGDDGFGLENVPHKNANTEEQSELSTETIPTSPTVSTSDSGPHGTDEDDDFFEMEDE